MPTLRLASAIAFCVALVGLAEGTPIATATVDCSTLLPRSFDASQAKEGHEIVFDVVNTGASEEDVRSKKCVFKDGDLLSVTVRSVNGLPVTFSGIQARLVEGSSSPVGEWLKTEDRSLIRQSCPLGSDSSFNTLLIRGGSNSGTKTNLQWVAPKLKESTRIEFVASAFLNSKTFWVEQNSLICVST